MMCLTIYYILLAGIVGLGIPLCEIRPVKWKELLYCGIMIAALSAIAGLRYMTGYDYTLYEGILGETYFLSWEDFTALKIEKGYLALNRAVGALSIEPACIFWAVGILIAVCVLVYIYKYSSNVWLSMFAFVTFGHLYDSMCFMRQYLAVMIILFALRYIDQNRFFHYLIWILLASTFHVSAMLMIPFYFILKIPMNRIVLAAYSIVGAVLYLFSYQLLDFATRFVYKIYTIDSEPELVTGIYKGICVSIAVLFVLCFLFRKDLVKMRSMNSILINCLFFGSYLKILGTKHALVSRFAILFLTPAVILLVSDLAVVWIDKLRKYYLKDNLKRWAPAMVYTVMAILMVINHVYFMKINYNGVAPYYSIFSDYALTGVK